jgi:hypothetical protein
MERSEAVTKLKKLEGVDLRPLAGKYAVTVWSGEKKNKSGCSSYFAEAPNQ